MENPTRGTQENGGERQAASAYAGKEPASLATRSIALSEQARFESVRILTQLQADTMTLRDLYKKHHWQAGGSTFYELHLLFDKHYQEQAELMDHIAERIQMLGGESLGCPQDVAEATSLPRPPRAAETCDRQLERLLEAHEQVLLETRRAARTAEAQGDDGTIDLLVSKVIPTHERQAWFITQQRGAGASSCAVSRDTH